MIGWSLCEDLEAAGRDRRKSGRVIRVVLTFGQPFPVYLN